MDSTERISPETNQTEAVLNPSSAPSDPLGFRSVAFRLSESPGNPAVRSRKMRPAPGAPAPKAAVAPDTAAMDPQKVRQTLAGQERAKLRALRAASSAEKQRVAAQEETARVREQLERAQRELTEERGQRVKASLDARTRISGLEENLASAAATTLAVETGRHNERRLYRFLLSGIAVALTILLVVLTRRGVTRESAPAPVPPVTHAAAPAPAVVTPAPARVAENASQALDRVERALSGYSEKDAHVALSDANHWLASHGAPACSVQTPQGETSLLVGAQNHQSGILAASLSRCAEAIEQSGKK